MVKIINKDQLKQIKGKGVQLVCFDCEICKKEDSYQLRNLKRFSELLCHSCRRYKNYHNTTFLNKIKEKTEKTSLEKYGVKHYTNREKLVLLV